MNEFGQGTRWLPAELPPALARYVGDQRKREPVGELGE
jgi:hypothetical protein